MQKSNSPVSVIRRWIPRRSDVNRDMKQALEFARNEALKGLIDSMRRFLDEAAESAERLKVDITDRSKMIERLGYENAVLNSIEQASEFAGQGNEKLADLYLQMADLYANHVDEKFHIKVAEARSKLQIKPAEKTD